MARGAEGKLRRRNERKEGREADPSELFDEQAPSEGTFEQVSDETTPSSETVAEDDTTAPSPPVRKSRKKKRNVEQAPPPPPSKGGIKMMPLIFLLMMTGTAVLPVLIYMGDYFGAAFQQSHVLGSVGFKLGIGPSPKKRVLSFYEKHDPTKISEVPKIMSKHYGDYPKLVKRLERKYQDYGYFLNWESDEAPMVLAKEQLLDTYKFINKKWDKHAPKPIKKAGRNMKLNFASVYRKFKVAWKKQIWPLLQPIFGVPEGGEKQKRKDAQNARKGKKGRKNKDFIEEEDE